MGRRFFTPEFKQEAVRLVRERGMVISKAAKDLGLNDNALRRWVSEANRHGSHFETSSVRMTRRFRA